MIAPQAPIRAPHQRLPNELWLRSRYGFAANGGAISGAFTPLGVSSVCGSAHTLTVNASAVRGDVVGQSSRRRNTRRSTRRSPRKKQKRGRARSKAKPRSESKPRSKSDASATDSAPSLPDANRKVCAAWCPSYVCKAWSLLLHGGALVLTCDAMQLSFVANQSAN